MGVCFPVRSSFPNLPAVLAAALLLAPGALPAETVIVGGEVGYEPFESLDQRGRPTGFNIDLWRAIGDEMDFEVEFRLGSWDEMREVFERGEIDAMGMFVSRRRAQSVLFAQPHLIVYHRIFTPAGYEALDNLGELAGRNVIVQRAAYSHEALMDFDFPVHLTLADSDAEALEMLTDGNHDAALLTEHRSRHHMARSGLDHMAVSGPPVLPVEYAIAVHPDRPGLLDTVNTGLDRVRASGEFDRIYDRWLQPGSGDAVTGRNGLVRALAISTAVLLVLVAVLAIWHWRHRRKVQAEQRQASEELDYLHRHDALTGVFNRPAFELRLAEFLNARADDDARHVLMSINIDQFRLINENHGHACGDQVLRELAQLLRRYLGDDALAGRFGDDEFVVLLRDHDQSGAIDVGRKLLRALRASRIETDEDVLRVTASIGLVEFSVGELELPRLLRRADCACLGAKDEGGNRVHTWRRDDRRLAERRGALRWVQEVQSALEQNRLAAWWQPIVAADMASDEPPAVEILARLALPGGDVVPAAQFMPAAERYYLAEQIDRWMLDHMLQWLAEHDNLLDAIAHVNINLSGRSLGDPLFLEFLRASVERAGSRIDKLCFEITETALIANLASARALLEELHAKGCRLALDDFGMGLSSMNYLRNLPVDYVKIDGSFTRDIDRDERALQIIGEINRLGHAMGKITVAEYVESRRIRKLLHDTGVDRLQGYAIARPAPLSELPAWCRRQRPDLAVNGH